MGIESAPDANSLGNPQTLGNGQALGKYSTMLESDIQAAEEAKKQAQAVPLSIKRFARRRALK